MHHRYVYIYIYIIHTYIHISCKRYPPNVPHIIIVQTCGKRWEPSKFVDVLSVNLGFSRLLIWKLNSWIFRILLINRNWIHQELKYAWYLPIFVDLLVWFETEGLWPLLTKATLRPPDGTSTYVQARFLHMNHWSRFRICIWFVFGTAYGRLVTQSTYAIQWSKQLVVCKQYCSKW